MRGDKEGVGVEVVKTAERFPFCQGCSNSRADLPIKCLAGMNSSLGWKGVRSPGHTKGSKGEEEPSLTWSICSKRWLMIARQSNHSYVQEFSHRELGWAIKYLLEAAPEIRFGLFLPSFYRLWSELQQEVHEPFGVGEEGACQKVEPCTF